MREEQIVNFINKNKHLIGFGNYEVFIKFHKNNGDGCKASINIDEHAQQLGLDLYKQFNNANDSTQINILLHELMHVREKLRQDRVETFTKPIMDYEEESFINDCTRLAESWEL